MIIYTAGQIAGLLQTSYKTVLNLIKRGHLKALPGIRHKRVTEEEFHRYLGVKSAQDGAAFTPAPARPLCISPATQPASPAGLVASKGKSLPNAMAKAVAPPVALGSQRQSK